MSLNVFLFLACLGTVDIVYGEELCDKPADIAFVIDSSSSIHIDDFKLQIQFVQELVNTFNIGPDKVHVAALKFSRGVANELYFNDVTTAQEASERIGKITHSAGTVTYTHSALEAVRKDLFSPSNGARADVSKICVLLTDGKSTQSTDTLEQARLTKEAGITIVAVGIGAANTAELEEIVSPPASENYVYASSFSTLKDKLKSVGKQACEVITTTPQPEQGDEPGKVCQDKDADILFVVDMSSSIWPGNFTKQLNFLADVVSFFDIDSGKTRVGMLTFSNSTEVSFYFDRYNRKTDVIQAIRQVKQKGGITNTHLALQVTASTMFSESFGSRRGAAHICIVITDGVSRLPAKTKSAAKIVQRNGVDVFAIGVGNQVNVPELNSIASKPEFVFEVNGYDALGHIENILAVKACEDTNPTDPGIECNSVVEDIVFAVDMSNSIWPEDFKKQLQFISGLITYFDIDSGDTRVGMLTYSTGTKVQFYLNAYDNKESLKEAILSVNTEGGLTNTHLALQKIREEMLRKENGQRPGVQQVCIVITDGESRQPKQTSYQADLLQDSGVDVFAIGVGEKVDLVELSEIASKPEYMFEVSGPDTLQNIKEILAVNACKVARKGP